jgi:ribosomal-protein-alanine N-acetyltransferase
MTLPDLRTPRLDLRPVTRDDIDSLHRFWTDPEVRRYLWDDEIISLSRSAGMVEASIASAESTGLGIWLMRLIGEKTLVGFCGFRPSGSDVELVYAVHPSHQRRGLATEASRAVLRYACYDLGKKQVIAGAGRPNRASIRVMEKLGFRYQETRVNAGREEEWWTLTASSATREFFEPLRRTASPQEQE